MGLFDSITTSLKDNPVIATFLAVGMAIGVGAGALLSQGNTLLGFGLATALGVVGAAGGFLAGSAAAAKEEEKKPAPLGMRQVSTAPLEPGKAGEVTMKAAPEIVNNAVDKFKETMPEEAKKMPQWSFKLLPLFATLANIQMKGDVSADGTQLTVTSATVNTPIRKVPLELPSIPFPLKDKQIDVSNPKTLEGFHAIGRHFILTRVKPQFKDRARDILDKTFETFAPNVVKPTTEKTDKLMSPAASLDPKLLLPAGGIHTDTIIQASQDSASSASVPYAKLAAPRTV